MPFSARLNEQNLSNSNEQDWHSQNVLRTSCDHLRHFWHFGAFWGILGIAKTDDKIN
jgi:hypothetical protein